MQGAITVLYEAFYPHENVCVAVDFADNPNAMKEMDELIIAAARDGVSLVAVEKSSGTVVGAAFNKIQSKAAVKEYENYFHNYYAKCKEPSTKAVLEFMMDFDGRCDLFSALNVDCLLEIMFLATLPSHRGKKISLKLCEASLLLAEALCGGDNVKVPLDDEILSLEPAPKVVWAIFTSFISQRIGEKLGFTRELAVSYDDLTYDGEKYSSKIDSKTPNVTIEYKRIM